MPENAVLAGSGIAQNSYLRQGRVPAELSLAGQRVTGNIKSWPQLSLKWWPLIRLLTLVANSAPRSGGHLQGSEA